MWNLHIKPNDQEITDPLSLNKYTYCHNNPVFYADPIGYFVLPFVALTGIAGTIAGAITDGISSALKGKLSWNAVAEGAVIGGMIGFTGGTLLAYGAAGSAVATTGAVMAGKGSHFVALLPPLESWLGNGTAGFGSQSNSGNLPDSV